MPRDIQPPPVATMLHYERTFHSNFSYLLMNRIYVILQQMFIDAQEIDENLQACEKIPK